MTKNTASLFDHVLILAPYRRDAEYLAHLLGQYEVHCEIGSSTDDLSGLLANAPAVLMATHEALTPVVISSVAEHVRSQPDWSEIPIVVLLDRASNDGRVRTQLERAWPRSRLLFYRRPVTTVELLSGVQSALLARHRQRDVRDHIEREVELRRELNHRVKNILASVSSIFEMTRRNATSVEALADDFRGRLNALDKVHSAVFKAETDNISLEDVATITLEPYRSTMGHRIVFGGPPVMLMAETGTSLALCLHELATNASKYGALSAPGGSVSFVWSTTGGPLPELALEWQESGGPLVETPAQAGYGTRYVRAALGGILGTKPVFHFEPQGLRVTAEGPLSRISAAT
ncbi:sensor histidine kinase [Pelagibacterium luteolum]|uniref:histidine kinase n=1 Tax=Pelagibacterium luteolum TaxID=440168 RepID=A0A1G7UX91_9HYPH|nr:sensor histidine kinase [Pelagibacterium luteolum]SDG52084.1 Two-component sensor histidine kinase, contains HisKA and HATPase domains [Pelagibacterium luteolum]